MRSNLLVFTPLLVAALPAMPDGPALVRQCLRASEAKAVQATCKIVLHMDLPGAAKTFTMSSILTAKPPNRIRVDSKSEIGEFRVVSDGESVWTWLSNLNQYTRNSVAAGALDQFRNLGFGVGEAAEAALARARTVRSEQILTGGVLHDCWLVEIPFERYPLPLPQGTELRNGTMQVWIDSGTYTVLRSDTAGLMHAPGMPSVNVRQSMVVTSIHIDAEIPDTVFQFEAPQGAQQVAAFQPRVR